MAVTGAKKAPARTGKSFRRKVAEALDPDMRRGEGLSLTNMIFATLVILSTVVVVLETEPSLFDRHQRVFLVLERIFATIFSIEYVFRAWSAQENPQFGRGWKGFLKYVFSIGSLVDLVAIIPTVLLIGGQATLSLRLFRVLRMLRVARLGRLSNAWEHMVQALASRREELFLAFCAGLMLMMLSSTCLYLVEGPVQPQQFGSIPRAMWWSVVTLTTIGYGDTVPITPLGKFLAAITALCGIGLIAMPTGIVAAALSDGVQRRRQAEMQARETLQRDKPDDETDSFP